jgi:hypothetical protein
MRILAVTAPLVGITLAQSTTVIDMFWGTQNPILVSQGYHLYGSVLAADPTATVYSVSCTASPNSLCDNDYKETMTVGPQVAEWTYTDPDSTTVPTSTYRYGREGHISCAIPKPSEATCLGEITYSGFGDELNRFHPKSISSTTFLATLTGTDIQYAPLTVTAGLDRLAAATGAASHPRYAGVKAAAAGAVGLVGAVMI